MNEPLPPDLPAQADRNWALCQTRFEDRDVTPVAVAVTYLDPGLDDELLPAEVRAWFGDMDGVMVDVYKLEHQNGRRRIAFELSRGKWPTWDQVARGQTGEAVCGLIRAALVRADIGRPAPAPVVFAEDVGDGSGPSAATDEPVDRSRHYFEFIYARRPALYRTVEWVGTLDHALELDTFVMLRQWLHRTGS